ncbi:MAG: zinc finger domain-containing protein [Candidatus Zixiibacteriota bacterium]
MLCPHCWGYKESLGVAKRVAG